MKQFYSIGEVATLLRVSECTLRTWDNLGIYNSDRRMNGGKRLYSIETVEQMLKDSNLTASPIRCIPLNALTAKEVRDYCQFSQTALTKLSDLGKLKPSYQNPVSGKKYYMKSDVDAYLSSISRR